MGTSLWRASAGDPDLRTSSATTFPDQLATAKHRVLLVDYDGTIAPFTASRDRAYPHAGVADLLDIIMSSCRTRVLLISGRPAREIPPLLGVDPCPEIWGTYGLECLYPDGRYEVADVGQRALRVLAQAHLSLQQSGLAEVAEVKPGAIAVHWRGLGTRQITEIRAGAYRAWSPLLHQADLVLKEFDGGLELRVRTPNKGDVVHAIVAELDPNVPVAYLGDDVTDEDAFRALSGRGLTVLVRTMYRFTAAQVWLRPPDDLIRFLSEWIAACGGEV